MGVTLFRVNLVTAYVVLWSRIICLVKLHRQTCNYLRQFEEGRRNAKEIYAAVAAPSAIIIGLQ